MIRTAAKIRGQVWGVAFFPPGPRLLVADGAGVVRAWDYSADEFGAVLESDANKFLDLAASDDGQTWLSRSRDGTARIHGPEGLRWSQRRGTRGGDPAGNPPEIDGSAMAAALTRDGRRVAVSAPRWGLFGYRMRVSLRDAADGTEVAGLTVADPLSCHQLALSGDGSRVAMSLGEHHALLWSLEPGHAPIEDQFSPRRSGGRRGVRSRLRRLDYGHEHTAKALAFSADGATLATVSGARVIVWDVAKAERLRTLTGHSRRVTAIAFPPAGPTLASASADGTLRFWNWSARTDPERFRIDCGLGPLRALAFSADGQLAAVGGADGCGVVALDERMLA